MVYNGVMDLNFNHFEIILFFFIFLKFTNFTKIFFQYFFLNIFCSGAQRKKQGLSFFFNFEKSIFFDFPQHKSSYIKKMSEMLGINDNIYNGAQRKSWILLKIDNVS